MNRAICILISIVFVLTACQQDKVDSALIGNWKTNKKWDYSNQKWIDFEAGTYMFNADGTFGMLSSDGKDISTIVSGKKEGQMIFTVSAQNEQKKVNIHYPESDKIFLSANISKNSPDTLVIETIESLDANKEMILFLKK